MKGKGKKKRRKIAYLNNRQFVEEGSFGGEGTYYFLDSSGGSS